MRLPDHLRVENLRVSQDKAVGDLVLDMTGFMQSFRESLRLTGKAMRQAAESLRKMTASLRVAANNEVRVSGLEARYYIRGGLACQTEQQIDALVSDLLTRPWVQASEDDNLVMILLTGESRARLAAAAIRGWAEQHPGEVESLTWYRLWGTSMVSVGRES